MDTLLSILVCDEKEKASQDTQVFV